MGFFVPYLTLFRLNYSRRHLHRGVHHQGHCGLGRDPAAVVGQAAVDGGVGTGEADDLR